MDEQDKLELEALMQNAPVPGDRSVSEDRHVTVVSLEAEHRAERVKRERLSADAEWVD